MEWLYQTWYGILTIILSFVLVLFLLSLIPVLYRKFFKRFYDFTLSLIAIILLSPVFIILIPVVAIAMKGNPFFCQLRPGKNEKIFKMIKFRTMTNEKDKDGNLLPDEVRLTKFGKLLRSTSVDELPELFNILIGNMSIVGPRPLLVKYLPRYNEEQKHRHDVKPGFTGLAQVNGRNAITWEKKFEFDCIYVRNYSLKNDIIIIMKTIFTVIKKEGISSDSSVTMEEFKGNKIYEDREGKI